MGTSGVGGALAFGGTAGTGGNTVSLPCVASNQGPYCDDDNPCTTDRCNNGTCEHVNLADNSPCSDSNACTRSDQCQAGQCLGQREPSEPAKLGQITTFSGAPRDGAAERVVFLSDSLAVFADANGVGSTLSLVSLSGDVAEVVDVAYSGAFISSTSGGRFPRRHATSRLLEVSPSRFMILGGRREGIEVWDVVGKKLVPRSLYYNTLAGGETVGAVSTGDYVWSCGTFYLESYRLSPEGTVELLAHMSLLEGCTDLALDSTKDELYVAGKKSLRVFDVSNPESPVQLGEPVLSGIFGHVDITPTHFLVKELAYDGNNAPLRLGLRADHSIITTFEPTLRVPLGAAFVPKGLLVHWSNGEKGDAYRYEIELYDLTGNLPVLRQRLQYYIANTTDVDMLTGRTPSMPRVSVTRPSGLEWYAHLRPGNRLVRFDGNQMTLESLPEQGNLGYLQALGPNTLLAMGPVSSHRIDVSDVMALRFEAGGLLSEPVRPWRVLSKTLETPAAVLLFLPYANQLPEQSGPLLVDQFTPSGSTAVVQQGNFGLDDRHAELQSSRGELFQFDRNTKELLSYKLPSEPMGGSVLEPFASQILDFGAPGLTGFKWSVEGLGQLLFVRYYSDKSQVKLWHFRRESGAWSLRATQEFPELIGRYEVYVHGNRGVLSTNATVRLFDLSQGGLTVQAEWQRELADARHGIIDIVGSYGETIYVLDYTMQKGEGFPDLAKKFTVIGLNQDTLALTETFPVDQLVQSVTGGDGFIAFGMPGAVQLARPYCGRAANAL